MVQYHSIMSIKIERKFTSPIGFQSQFQTAITYAEAKQSLSFWFSTCIIICSINSKNLTDISQSILELSCFKINTRNFGHFTN